jgi:hypothetical protein
MTTIDPKLIDRKALDAAVRNPEAWFAALPLTKKLAWNSAGVTNFDYQLGRNRTSGWYLPDLRSVLYSLQAHLRGHMHGAKKYNPRFDGSGGRQLDERGMRDQEALVGTRWQFFLKPEAQARLDACVADATPSELS